MAFSRRYYIRARHRESNKWCGFVAESGALVDGQGLAQPFDHVKDADEAADKLNAANPKWFFVVTGERPLRKGGR